MNNSKRKLLSTIGSLALVLVIAVGGVIGALAALSANVQSTFSISYTAHNVHAIITGSYYQSATQTSTTIPGSPIQFFGDETGTPEKSFSKVENLTIPTPTDYINMFYTIKNTSDTPFGATLNFVATTSTNMKITYCTQYWDGEAETLPSATELSYTDSTLPAMYIYGNESNKEKSAIVIGVHVQVDDVVKDASLDAHLDFDLNSQAEDPNKPLVLEKTGKELWDFMYNKTYEKVALYDSPYGIIFDYYTAEGVYNVDGENVLEGAKEIDSYGYMGMRWTDKAYFDIQEGVRCYVFDITVTGTEDYAWKYLILSNSTIFANANQDEAFGGYFSSMAGEVNITLKNFNTTNVISTENMFNNSINKITVGSGWTLGDDIFPENAQVEHV